jgi:hypothetical protein
MLEDGTDAGADRVGAVHVSLTSGNSNASNRRGWLHLVGQGAAVRLPVPFATDGS